MRGAACPLAALALCACTSAAPGGEAYLLGQAARFLDDPAFRRKALVDSLVNPDNTYSRQRLASYGLGDRGWDLLPEWNPRSRPLERADAARFARGERPAVGEAVAPLWDGARPATMAEWVALGREVFFGYPLRAEVLMEFALERPALAAEVGLEEAPDGTFPGLRVFEDLDGRSRVAITCALCHASVRDGALVVGAARRRFDYGRLRLAYHRTTGVPVAAELARRMERWGPGRADVTEDDDEDPVAIPDLWGLRVQSALTQAGTIRHTGPAALAIRQETQLLSSNHQRVRPPRELAYALALYLYSLAPPPRAPPPAEAARRAEGKRLFAAHCRHCHANPALGGEPIAAAQVGTDPALATGRARGTGAYRPPALLDVAHAAPYLHHGAVSILDDLLAPERLAPGYDRSPLGPGPVLGHAYGTSLPPADRAALVAYLNAL
jgi:mono/diheme cytochrome c family protein